MHILTLSLNGKDMECKITEGSLALVELLKNLDINAGQAAIKLNNRFLRRADLSSTIVNINDKLEIVTLLAGG